MSYIIYLKFFLIFQVLRAVICDDCLPIYSISEGYIVLPADICECNGYTKSAIKWKPDMMTDINFVGQLNKKYELLLPLTNFCGELGYYLRAEQPAAEIPKTRDTSAATVKLLPSYSAILPKHSADVSPATSHSTSEPNKSVELPLVTNYSSTALNNYGENPPTPNKSAKVSPVISHSTIEPNKSNEVLLTTSYSTTALSNSGEIPTATNISAIAPNKTAKVSPATSHSTTEPNKSNEVPMAKSDSTTAPGKSAEVLPATINATTEPNNSGEVPPATSKTITAPNKPAEMPRVANKTVLAPKTTEEITTATETLIMTTCPFNCQNGFCFGEECICGYGYKLESEHCVPVCKDNCRGYGTCIAPNTCSCRVGYQTSVDGSCKPACDRCTNGDCIAPDICQCRPGYTNNENGECTPYCSSGCGLNGQCIEIKTCANSPAFKINQPQVLKAVQLYPNVYPTYNNLNSPSNPYRSNYLYPNYNWSDYYPFNMNVHVQQTNKPSNYPRFDRQPPTYYSPLHYLVNYPHSTNNTYYSNQPYKPDLPHIINDLNNLNQLMFISRAYNPTNQPNNLNRPNYGNQPYYPKPIYPFQPPYSY